MLSVHPLSHGPRRARALTLCAGLLLATTQLAKADVITVTWVGPASGNWSDPANWSPPVVPNNTASDQYVVVIPSGRTITVDAALPSSISLNAITLPRSSSLIIGSSRQLSLSDDSGLHGHASVFTGASLLTSLPAGSTPGALSQTTLAVSGTFRSAATSYSGVDVPTGTTLLSNSGSLDLRSITSFSYGTTGSDQVTHEIRAFSGVLDLSNLTTLTRVGNSMLTFTAQGSGIIRLPQLTAIHFANLNLSGTGQIQTGTLTNLDSTTIAVSGGGQFAAPGITSYSSAGLATATILSSSGATSLLALPNLTTLSFGNATNSSVVHTISATSAGTINLPSVTTLNRINGFLSLTVSSGGTINLPALTTFNNTTISINQGNLNVGALTSIDGSTISLTNTSYTLPAGVTTYSPNSRGSATLFSATGAGSVLDLTSLTSLAFGTTAFVSHGISATSGAIVELSNVAALQRAPRSILSLTADSGSTIRLPLITALPGLTLNLSGTGQIQLGSYSSFDGAAVVLTANAPFTLPAAITSYSTLDRPSTTIFSADGAGTTLNLTSLTSLSVGSSASTNTSHTISATSGGIVDLSNVSSITHTNSGILALTATANSIIRLPQINTLDRTTLDLTGNALVQMSPIISLNASSITVRNGAQFVSPASVSSYSLLDRPFATFHATGTGAVLNLSTIQSLQLSSPAATIQLNVFASQGGVLDVSGLTTLNHAAISVVGAGSQVRLGALTSIDGSTVNVNGASLALPAGVTHYSPLALGNMAIFDTTAFPSSSSPSTLDLSALHSLDFGSTAAPSVEHIIRSTSQSTINLSGLTTLNRVNAGNLTLDVRPGSTILMPQITELRDATVLLGGSLVTGTLTSIDGSMFLVQNVPFTTPVGLTSYTQGDRHNPFAALGLFQVTGSASAVLNLSSLRTLNLGDPTRPNRSPFFSANTRLLDLSNVNTINFVNGARLTLNSTNNGTINLSSLPIIHNIDITQSSTSGGVIFAAAMAMDASTLTITGSFIAPPSLTSISAGNLPAGNLISLAGTLIDLSHVTNLTVGSSTSPATFHAISAAAGTLDLSALNSITALNNGGVRFSVGSTGTLRLPSLDITPNTSLAITNSSILPAHGLRLTSSLFIHSTNPADFDAATGRVIFAGGSIATLEAAGLDLGPGTLPIANFAIGQLVLGDGSLAARVELADLINNSAHTPGTDDALYLLGIFDPATAFTSDGLILNNGSHLYLTGNINVYARINNQVINLRSLFAEGQTQVALGNGFLNVPTPNAAALLALSTVLASRRQRPRINPQPRTQSECDHLTT